MRGYFRLPCLSTRGWVGRWRLGLSFSFGIGSPGSAHSSQVMASVTELEKTGGVLHEAPFGEREQQRGPEDGDHDGDQDQVGDRDVKDRPVHEGGRLIHVDRRDEND